MEDKQPTAVIKYLASIVLPFFVLHAIDFDDPAKQH